MAQRRILDLTEAAAPKDDMYVPVDHGNDGTQRISTAALLANTAKIDGAYEEMTVGNAEQLVSTLMVEDQEPYNFRTSGGPADIGNRAYDTFVGGSVVWNQLIARENATTFNTSIVSYSDGIYTVSYPEGNSSSSYVLSIPVNGYDSSHKYFRFFKIVDDSTYVNMRLYLPGGNTYTSSKETLESMSARGGSIVTGGTTSIFQVNKTSAVTDAQSLSFRIMFIDLTALLTPEVADYIYTLEQANAGAGVAYFRKYFPEEYHEYCEPHFEHVQTDKKVTVGFNQWDEEWEVGSIDPSTGLPTSGVGTIRSKNYIRVLPSTTYYFHCEAIASMGSGNRIPIYCYDSDKNYIGRPTPISVNNETFVTPDNCHYIKFRCGGEYGSTYNNDICINLHWSGTRDGEYEAYQKREYPIAPIVLRGIPKLDANGDLYFDGDMYEHDGTVTRRYGVYTYDGSENWLAYDYEGKTSFRLPNNAVKTNSGNCVTDKGFEYARYAWASTTQKLVTPYSGYLYFRDPSIETLADWKASLQANPITVVCELATPTTETAEPFQYPMVVDDWGTEELVDYGVEQGTRDVAIPVGHYTEYPANLRDKLQHLPDLADGDGRYVIVQTGTQQSLAEDTSPGRLTALEAKIPNPPTTDGTYTLKAVVVDGSPTFSWVSE